MGRPDAYYAKDSTATLRNKLYDPYVKFFRWAVDRLERRDGIVCFVSNNSFVVDQDAFRGMRKHLANEFTTIYHIDLHGNVRQNISLSGTSHNVFGIKVGVGITIAIRSASSTGHKVFYTRVPEQWRKEEKLAWLAQTKSIAGINFTEVRSNPEHAWIETANIDEHRSLLPLRAGGKANRLFKRYSPGAKSNRDDIVYDFSLKRLQGRVKEAIENYNSEVDRYRRAKRPRDIDNFVDVSKVKWSSTLKRHLEAGRYATYESERFRICMYRPFTKLYIYYDEVLTDRPGLFRDIFPTVASELKNMAIVCTSHSQAPFSALMVRHIANEATGGRAGTCYPLSTYDRNSRARTDNISSWALDEFRAHYKDDSITNREIFFYIYAVLHHPGYLAQFKEVLRRNSPRLPFVADFEAFVAGGKKLAALHTNYESLEPYQLEYLETDSVPLSYRVDDRMRLSRDGRSLRINSSLTLMQVPVEADQFRIGARSPLKWVLDQYRVGRDTHGIVTSDPNNEEDNEYVVRLVGQVIRVGIESLDLARSLPKAY